MKKCRVVAATAYLTLRRSWEEVANGAILLTFLSYILHALTGCKDLI